MPTTFSKKSRSGTPEYPTPRLLVERMVAELVNFQKWSWVTFETKPLKHFVEVSFEAKDELVVNVAYWFSEDYHPVFERLGIVIPEGWRVTKFKKKGWGWFSGGTMLLTTGIRDIDRVAGFVDQLFLALYGEQPGYCLSGVYQ